VALEKIARVAGVSDSASRLENLRARDTILIDYGRVTDDPGGGPRGYWPDRVALMAANRPALRVVFAEDNYLVREGTAALLAEVDEIDLVRSVEDPESLVTAVAELSPDAVLTDIRMPPTYTTEGIAAAKHIRRAYPGTAVVVLSQYVEADYAFELLADGVAGLGYLLKERVHHVDELVRALQDVCHGRSALDPKVVEGLVVRKSAEKASPLRGLTDRELGVLEHMATGRSNAAIARQLYLSERAIEKHISSLFQKLDLPPEGDVNRRVAAVLAFLKATGTR
jgi:DNA-binding NarL/FixJ family response regulator